MFQLSHLYMTTGKTTALTNYSNQEVIENCIGHFMFFKGLWAPGKLTVCYTDLDGPKTLKQGHMLHTLKNSIKCSRSLAQSGPALMYL